MDKTESQEVSPSAKARSFRPVATGCLILGVVAAAAVSHQALRTAPAAAAEARTTQPLADEPPEYGEYLARPDALAPVAVNDIVKSIRLNATAMMVGKTVYEKHCASCHGADLKGSREQHAPDLTDANWMFSGDDLPSGGAVKFPSDVEWTVRYGIRSGHENARGNEADMLAFDPRFRTEDDTKEFGSDAFLNAQEIEDVAEYVLEISGQQFDRAKARRGNALFHDNAKGNCFDCHTDEGTGNDAIGSANLTQPELFLYGADRATIIESITKGRRGVMPGFEDTLTPSELKAVSVYVFAHAAVEGVRPK